MPTTLLRITDETLSGDTIREETIRFPKDTVTVKNIIASRVETEVAKYNNQVSEHFNGLIRPTSAEETLNGYKMKKRAKVDAEKQVYVALDAFQKNGYFVFIDDTQAENLDQEVHITPDTKVSFIKLTPLVGG
jgi:hypothetical protein